MIIIKTQSEIERLRSGGPVLARILAQVAAAVAPGVTTKSLDDLAYRLIAEAGHRPAFLNYTPGGARRPFPASLCVSVNEQIVHGLPGDRVLKTGDVVSLDLGLSYEGVILDHAVTVPVGKITAKEKKLLDITKQALEVGIHAVVPGATVGDIGAAIEQFVKPYKFGITRDLSGHGVGRSLHEDPDVPNYGKKGTGPKLKPGMVIAIEPMLTLGSEEVIVEKDGFTLSTPDRSKAAHFEHTVLITDKGAEILTK